MAQTTLGKAFEYACVKALYEHYSKEQEIIIIKNEPYETAKGNFESAKNKQDDLMAGARAAIRVLNRLEPRLTYPNGSIPLYLSLQTDATGQEGDVRDILCVRHGDDWKIGISCKHNHAAVKHSRLSNSIDFGMKWFGVKCSEEYFNEIRPVFDELAELRDKGKKQNRLIKFEDFDDVNERFYKPVLDAFIKELKRLDKENEGIPAKLVHYLMGEHDFYKVITDDSHRVTTIEGININGTLGRPSEGHRGITAVPILKLPTEFLKIRLKHQSKTTIEVICDNAWTLTMRIHSAKKEVEPSLKFDINHTGTPSGLYIEMEPWDK